MLSMKFYENDQKFFLEEINHYGKNRLIYYKQCKLFTKNSFYKELDKLIREHQMKYNKKLLKNKI